MAVRIKCDSTCEESEAKLRCCMHALAVATKIRAEKRAAFAPSIPLATISTWNLVFDPPACSPRRFENFLPGGAAHDAMYCVKGQKNISPAISKTFFKNARIGTRTHAREEWSQRGSNPPGSHEPLLHRRCNRGS